MNRNNTAPYFSKCLDSVKISDQYYIEGCKGRYKGFDYAFDCTSSKVYNPKDFKRPDGECKLYFMSDVNAAGAMPNEVGGGMFFRVMSDAPVGKMVYLSDHHRELSDYFGQPAKQWVLVTPGCLDGAGCVRSLPVAAMPCVYREKDGIGPSFGIETDSCLLKCMTCGIPCLNDADALDFTFNNTMHASEVKLYFREDSVRDEAIQKRRERERRRKGDGVRESKEVCLT